MTTRVGDASVLATKARARPSMGRAVLRDPETPSRYTLLPDAALGRGPEMHVRWLDWGIPNVIHRVCEPFLPTCAGLIVSLPSLLAVQFSTTVARRLSSSSCYWLKAMNARAWGRRPQESRQPMRFGCMRAFDAPTCIAFRTSYKGVQVRGPQDRCHACARISMLLPVREMDSRRCSNDFGFGELNHALYQSTVQG